MPSGTDADILLVGGGLANSLIALRLKAKAPRSRVVLFEREARPTASHTWSFFHTDVSTPIWRWLAPLAAHRWSGYTVAFPRLRRTLATEYASLTSDGLRHAVQAALGDDFRSGVAVAKIAPDRVETDTGEVFAAPLVIDGRGARHSASMALAWQKFVGLELRLTAPHGLERPVVMDATVPQLDGFRFLYVLPLSADTLLIEDTRYSDGPDLDAPAYRDEIIAYAKAKGWTAAEVIRQESGVLPVVLGGDIDAYWAEADPGVAQSGLRAALFHPTTGYSLPEAARLADAIAGADRLDSATISAMIERRSKRTWRARGYFRLLNRMMFLAAEPDRRYRVLERFYRLSPGLIERFYAGELTPIDRARLLMGEPPVPIPRAMAALRQRAAFPRRSHA